MKKVLVAMLVFVLVFGFSTFAVAAHAGGGSHGGGGGHSGGFSGGHPGGFSGGDHSGGFRPGGHTGGYRSPGPDGGPSHVGGYRSPGHIGGNYGSGYRGGYPSYSYRGYAPRGAILGGYWGGVVVGGIFSPFWWPFYAMPVPYGYYDSYGYPSYYQPQYVVVVPQAVTNQQAPLNCYGPQVDQTGNMLRDKDGNLIPDFTKPVSCPPQSAQAPPPSE